MFSSFFTVHADAPEEKEAKEEPSQEEEAEEPAQEEEEEEEPEDVRIDRTYFFALAAADVLVCGGQPLPAIVEECEQSAKCAPMLHHFQHCEEKVNAGEGYKGEDCVEEL
ncbi:hypothetical protein TRAPUB_13781 [Trametes pubescens]|uniref:Ubiquinol-cytochrome C reductase hinge domain-containing protein n=1 Tax=Trametes pubescens TaxID=154538 RepID=A0A1M2VQB9_TRAPU|nr:hypothetical protein TRAPUB_13781 [Trametes pubescens]